MYTVYKHWNSWSVIG